MGSPAGNIPSPAQLLERCRAKIRAWNCVLYPVVSLHIQQLKVAKRSRAAQEREDGEYKTINHLDLANVVLLGVAIQAEQLTIEAGWSVVVEGPDTEGEILSVSLFLPNDETEPLEIRSFSLTNLP